jgi:gluconokinase
MEERGGHFMPPGLLDSQLAALEPPMEAIQVDVAVPPEVLIERIASLLSQRGETGTTGDK